VRKEQDLEYTARIHVQLAGADAIEAAAKAFSEVIATETLAESISVGDEIPEGANKVSVEVDGHALEITIEVAS
jgi:hypothetical protein